MIKLSLATRIATVSFLVFSMVGEPAIAAPKAAANGYQAQISIISPLKTMRAGETVVLSVKVKNTSSETWTSAKNNPFRVSYHWRNLSDNKAVVWDGIRTFITKNVVPGEKIAIKAQVKSPETPGQYILQLDVVKDGKGGGWFGHNGSPILSIPVTVK